MRAKKLTPRQKLFVREYLKDLNGTQAVIRAGYSKNKQSAKVIASRLLTNVNVQPAVAEALLAVEKKLDISIEHLWLELGRIAFSDLRRCYHSDGSLKKISEVDEDAAAALRIFEEKIVYHRGQSKAVRVVNKIRLWDKPGAIEKLLRFKFRVAEKVSPRALACRDRHRLLRCFASAYFLIHRDDKMLAFVSFSVTDPSRWGAV